MSGVVPRATEGTVVTVGSFDGVHIGHQAVLAEVARRAQAARRASVLVRPFGQQSGDIYVKGAPECMRDICVPGSSMFFFVVFVLSSHDISTPMRSSMFN